MKQLFTQTSQAIFWNNDKKAIQRMLDYDFVCRRKIPSVSAIVNPRSGAKFHPFFFGSEEIRIPMYRTLEDCVACHPNAEVFLNFASFRSAYEVTKNAFSFPSIRTIVIAAEGIPERQARELKASAKAKGKLILGPATVGAILPGNFKTANICGTIDNIIRAKLHRVGSAGVIT
ncbi:MAG: ATP citrate synthase, partial [Candidatus Margulisbacteria bacterium]|nr:ATP citrate synthase [Candidatus Margulisiibacteriota bacterium]